MRRRRTAALDRMNRRNRRVRKGPEEPEGPEETEGPDRWRLTGGDGTLRWTGEKRTIEDGRGRKRIIDDTIE